MSCELQESCARLWLAGTATHGAHRERWVLDVTKQVIPLFTKMYKLLKVLITEAQVLWSGPHVPQPRIKQRQLSNQKSG